MFVGRWLKLLLVVMLSAALPRAVCAQNADDDGFLARQKKFERVKVALQEKADLIDRQLETMNLARDKLNVLFVAYKAENRLDIYAKKPEAARYSKLTSWRICHASGKPGPKRKQGDKQVPEGFYQIDRFNPVSNAAHMSLGINYPNAADRRKSRAANLGGDIFIHGHCFSIGCLAITDDKIREIYLYAVYARNSGQKIIPVYMFPFEMTPKNMKKYGLIYGYFRPEWVNFWRNLKTGYDQFMSDGKPLVVSVTPTGDYRFGP